MKVLDNEKGLTLVEVIASLLIFSLALLLLSNYLVRNYEITGNQTIRQVGMNLARQTIEEWKNGKGRIDDSITFDTMSSQLKTTYENNLLDYSDLVGLIDKNHGRFEWNPIRINDRNYDTEVQISKIASDPTDTSNPLILIRVVVSSGGAEMARLETLMPDPAFG